MSQPSEFTKPATPWTPPPAGVRLGIIPLRPIGVGEILDGAIGYARQNPKTVLGLAAVLSLASSILTGIGLAASSYLLSGPLLSTELPTAGTDASDLIQQLLAQLIPGLLTALISMVASGLFIVLIGAGVLGRSLDSSAAWANIRPRALPLIGLGCLMGLAIGAIGLAAIGGAVALAVFVPVAGWALAIPLGLSGLVAMVWLYVRWSLAPAALTLEGVSIREALRRSGRLVRRSWWRVAGITMLAAVITGTIAGLVTAPLMLLGALFANSGAAGIITVGLIVSAMLASFISGIITLPFQAGVTGLVYIDARFRREALDFRLVRAGTSPESEPLLAYRQP
jgi:hypothetical protein